MSVFQSYADYYDVLYSDKDYGAECDFLESIFGRYCNRPVRTILDLGCGTGGHTFVLAERGYQISGLRFRTRWLVLLNPMAGIVETYRSAVLGKPFE